MSDVALVATPRRAARVAAIYDVHGNLPALAAVLDAVRAEGVDLVVVGGDVVPGPWPGESLARLLAVDPPAVFLHGNGDRVVHAAHAGGDVTEVPASFRDGIHWTAACLDASHHGTIAAWPPSVVVDVDGLGPTLFCHASPRNDVDIVTRLTPPEVLVPWLTGVVAGTVVCGHTHMPFDRRVGRWRVVNPGSVGMPFSGPAGAYWALIGADVRLVHTPYDTAATAAAIRATTYPQRELAARYVADPPDEAASLAMFGAAS